jgi:hypothetical protein
MRCAHTNVVILGALVGAGDTEKKSILTRLADHMLPGSIILARGVEGLAQLLYPPVPSVASLTYHGRVSGDATVINTIEIFTVPDRS